RLAGLAPLIRLIPAGIFWIPSREGGLRLCASWTVARFGTPRRSFAKRARPRDVVRLSRRPLPQFQVLYSLAPTTDICGAIAAKTEKSSGILTLPVSSRR